MDQRPYGEIVITALVTEIIASRKFKMVNSCVDFSLFQARGSQMPITAEIN